jgi:hypothetical protein
LKGIGIGENKEGGEIKEGKRRGKVWRYDITIFPERLNLRMRRNSVAR